MAHPQNRSPLSSVLRIAVPVLVLAIGVGVFFSILRTSKSSTPAPTTPATTPATTSSTPAPKVDPADSDRKPADTAAKAPAADPSKPQPATPAPSAALGALTAKPQPVATLLPIGSLERDAKDGKVTTPFHLQVKFTQVGAGIDALTLSRVTQGVEPTSEQEVLQRIESNRIEGTDITGTTRVITRKLIPFGVFGIELDGKWVDLSGSDAAPVWQQIDAGHFQAEIIDERGEPVARIMRRYVLAPGQYTLLLEQRVENLTANPLSIVWHQAGPGDVPVGILRYGGDVRRVRLGYVGGPSSNPDGQIVSSSRYLIAHANLLGEPLDEIGRDWSEVSIWPQPDTAADQSKLSWAALTNRYFAVGMFALPDRQAALPNGLPNKAFSIVDTIDRVVLAKGGADKGERMKQAVTALRIKTHATSIPQGGAADLSMGMYAGPITHTIIDADPKASTVNLGGLVIYTFGGPCAFCTFQFLTYTLRWYVGFLHDNILFDWALSIIFLVITVRTILHPVAKWSQTQIQQFSKQMQKIAPKQAALKERYGNDQAKFREEVAKLMKDEQINYTGALGCIPLFLQTPIWIALSAMVFFTFEFRHSGAFYGLFQKLTGGSWHFLADLSEPDKFIPLGTSFSIPLLSNFMGPIDSINLIPLLLGVLFFLQQKYMMPPPTTQLTPEMEQQQKLTKVMMVVMMPVFMYNAPSALGLYFLVSSSISIFESKYIRAHIAAADKAREEYEKSLPPAEKRRLANTKETAKPGFIARMRAALDEKMQQAEKIRAEQEKLRRKGKGK